MPFVYVVWKGFTLNIGEKTKTAYYRKVYGIFISIFLCGAAFCIMYPVMSKAEGDVVFLRTTFPAETVVSDAPAVSVSETLEDETLDISEPDISSPESSEDTEDRLVSMLMKDDAQVVYDKLEDKEKWHVVHMRVTGYCSCAKCCGNFADGKTANCHKIRKGDVFVAADKRYRFGTEMIIPGYNGSQPVDVRDRGRAIKGNKLDIYFDSHKQAQKWGVKYLDVLVKTGE